MIFVKTVCNHLEGEYVQFPRRYQGKEYGSHIMYSGVSVNEAYGKTVLGQFDKNLATALIINEAKENHSGKLLKIENIENLDWGSKSLLVQMEIQLNDIYPTETKVSLVVAPYIRDNPPKDYKLPNDVHYTCKHAWLGI